MGKKKGKCLWLLVALLVLGGTPVFALDLITGVETEFIINKDVKCENLDIDADYTAQNYDVKTDILLGGIARISPKVGVTVSSLETSVFDTNIEADSGIGFNVGVDAEIKAYQSEYVDLSVIGSYRYSRVDIDEIDIGGLVIDNPIETILATHEWEVGVKVSKDLTELTGVPVTPYLGVVYSDLRGTLNANLSVIDLEEDIRANDNIGIRTGCDWAINKDLKVGVGLKLIDETAVVVAGTYRF
jgi:hypothetical protein